MEVRKGDRHLTKGAACPTEGVGHRSLPRDRSPIERGFLRHSVRPLGDVLRDPQVGTEWEADPLLYIGGRPVKQGLMGEQQLDAQEQQHLAPGLQGFALSSGIAAPTFTAGTGGPNGTQALVITGGGGTGATATAVVAAGAVTAINVTNGGSGYTSNPTITITGGGGTGGSLGLA